MYLLHPKAGLVGEHHEAALVVVPHALLLVPAGIAQ